MRPGHELMARDLAGRSFGRLGVLRQSAPRAGDTNYRYYDCVCECGTPAPHVRGDSLLNGKSRSCGCLRRETTVAVHTGRRKKVGI